MLDFNGTCVDRDDGECREESAGVDRGEGEERVEVGERE